MYMLISRQYKYHKSKSTKASSTIQVFGNGPVHLQKSFIKFLKIILKFFVLKGLNSIFKIQVSFVC